jgi:tetratricopeptide (TPR) repeat protein
MTAAPTKQIEVFYSYAHTDERLRKNLEAHLSNLKRQGIITEWHDRNISAGTDWADEVNTHLNTAHLILLLISADFIASDYCYSLEAKRAIERHEAREARVIPILLRPVEWKGVPFEKLQALPANAKPVTKWQNRDDAFLDIAKGIRNAIEELNTTLSNISFSPESIRVGKKNESAPLRLWNIPYRRNPFFTGREDILRGLHNALTTDKVAALSQPQAISGLGGMGKTQTALEYAYRYRDNYHVILWANADTYETLVADLTTIVGLLNLPEKNEQDQALIVNAIKRWLQVHSDWLLILDNVEHPVIVSDLIPQLLRGHILMTTRLQAVGALAGRVEIDKMEPEVGALFLLRRVRIIASDTPLALASEANQNKAREISQLMDGLPLALDQAGSYIEETQCGLFRYLDLYQRRRAELLKRRGQSSFDHPESVTTTFSLSFEKVQQANTVAAELLKLLTFFYPNDIPEEIIFKGSSDLGPVLQPAANDPLAFNEAIGALLTYSLLRRDPDIQTITIHRLIQAVLYDMMDEEMRHMWAERAVRAVNKVFPDVDFITWSLYQRYLPHAHTCAEHIRLWNMEFPEAARLLSQTANYLQNSAQYVQAESLYQRALAIFEKILGPGHPDTASSLSQLAWNYYSQSNFVQARQFAQQALSIREKVLGLEHPDTASSLNQVAVISRKQGNYVRAEQLYQRALAIYVQTEGLEHPQAAFLLQNLAVLYRSQRKYDQAEKYALQALAIREKIFGREHRDTTFNYNILAQIYIAQGKYEQAENLLQQAITIYEKIFGPDHPLVATSLKSMGNLYFTQGKFDKAELFYQQALSVEQTLQLETLDTTFTLNHLARLYAIQGKYDQAEPLYLKAITISERLFGLEQPNLISNLNNLIKIYAIQGKYDQAEPLYRRVLAIHEQTMGLESPNTAIVLMKYAELLRKLKRTTEAAELESRAEMINAKSLSRTSRERNQSTFSNLPSAQYNEQDKKRRNRRKSIENI